MAITRINNNQISDASAGNAYVGINAAAKLQAYSITAGKIANSLVYGSDLTVSGNLTINGQTTTVDTVSVVIEDPVLLLASNQTGAPAVDIGFIGERGTSQNIAFVWDESAGEFVTVYTNDTTTNTTVTIASYANFHTNDANIGGNIVINGTTSLVGNLIGNLNVTGNIAGGNLLTPGLISATGNVTAGNVSTGIVTASGNVTGANFNTAGLISATGNISTGTNIFVAGYANVTNTVTAGNVNTGGTVSATGNVTGGNINTGGVVSATGNVETSANLVASGYAAVTGNIDGGNLRTSGLVTATGNVTGGNINTGGIVSATGNVVTGANLVASGYATVTGNVTGGNLITAGLATVTGNITGGNITTTGKTLTGTLEVTADALVTGNLTVQGNLIYVNVEDLRVQDPIIQMGGGANGNALVTNDGYDRGTLLTYYSTAQGNAFMGWDNSTGNMFIASNVSVANEVVTVNSYGTLQGGNAYFETSLVTGNVTGGNVLTGGLISATGNIDGGNLRTGGLVTSTGNVTGGNINTGGLVSATGNVETSANLVVAGYAAVTGNIDGGNLRTAGLVTATGNIIGGANLVISGYGNITGNVNGGNINTGGLVTATGNVTGGNINTGGLVTATGNIGTGANLIVAGYATVTGNITGGNLITTGQSNLGNIRISGDNITDTNGRVNFNTALADVDFAVNGAAANVFYVDAGANTASFGNSTQTTNAIVAFNATNSILIPVGNTSQRPGTPVTGMIRFNSSTDSLEFYDADSWTSAGTVFTVVQSETFNGDGSTVAFTINDGYTTASCLVFINGVCQIPVTAYAVSGTTLTFTEAPETGDVVEVREIVTSTTVKGITNAAGTAQVNTPDGGANVEITGDLIPTANASQDLGSVSNQWKDLYLSGNSIYLGNLILKNTSGNTFAFFGPDGTTPGTLDSNNVDTTSIANGTANVRTFSASGNAAISAGGTANVLVVASDGLHVTGNITTSGNIIAPQILSITSPLLYLDNEGSGYPYDYSIGMFSNFIGGTGNTYQHTGCIRDYNDNTWKFASNCAEPTGNVFSFTNAVYDAVKMGQIQINAGANVTAIVNNGGNGVGNIGSATAYFNTVFAKATSAQYADLAEMYEADAAYEPGTVVSFGGNKEVTSSAVANDTRVAGVVSTNPSYLMNSAQTGEHVVAVALQGRVPCKVTGTIRKGDLMVPAGDGRATANNEARTGTVIGKALADFDGADGVIEVVVGRV